MSNETKLAALRAKTDRELLVLIDHELDRVLKLVSSSDQGSAFHDEAQCAYRKVSALLLKSTDASGWRRVLAEGKMKALRSSLDRKTTTVHELEPYLSSCGLAL